MEELLILEESIKNARQPSEDLFGIERRFCNVCEEGCIGYQPHQILFPSQLTHQFPTFCKNCKCPAYFHQLTFNSEELVYPEDLIQNLKNYNITSKDLNFNCVLATFQVRNTEKEVQNLLELTSLLKDEGFEVLSVDKRLLEFEEAIYFKSRMVGQTENLLL